MLLLRHGPVVLLLSCLVLPPGGCTRTPPPSAVALTEKTPPPPAQRYLALAAGGWHTCALGGAGKAFCWGWNRHGQLGTGYTEDLPDPHEVQGLPGKVVALAAGGAHTCAVLAGGAVHCWGWNNVGQTGAKAPGDVALPRKVALAGPATGISAGWMHSCALLRDGKVHCWGKDRLARPGRNYQPVYPPGPVAGLPGGMSRLVAGAMHACALTPSGEMRCWGRNEAYQLGKARSPWDAGPGPVPGLEGAVVAATAGYFHSCAAARGGIVRCWGENRSGQLGRTPHHRLPAAEPVPGLDAGVTALAAGWGHTCALLKTRQVRCWGDNSAGQLGTGKTASTGQPQEVVGDMPGVSDISAGKAHTCALLDSGDVRCWGENRWGQLGNGSAGDPVLAPGSVSAPLPGPAQPKQPRARNCGACKNECGPCPEPKPCARPAPLPCPPCPTPCPPHNYCPPCPKRPACPPLIACSCPRPRCPPRPEPSCAPCLKKRTVPCPQPPCCEACQGPIPCPSPGSPCPSCPEGYRAVPHEGPAWQVPAPTGVRGS